MPPCPDSPTSRWSTTRNWTDCFGAIIFSDGSKYVGEWKDSKWHGEGTLYNTYGGVEQEGIFENNKFLYAKSLSPRFTAKKSLTKGGNLPPCPEQGVWNKCVGTFTFPDGNKYVGEWKDDKMHGQGTYANADGSKYVGEWKDSIRYGQGTQTYADGRVVEGIFENNNFLYAKKLSPTVTAQKTPSNGSNLLPCPPRIPFKIISPFDDCVGIQNYPNGSKYVGEWKDGKKHGQGTFTH